MKKFSDYYFCAVFQGRKCSSYAVFSIQNEPGTQHQNAVLINFKSIPFGPQTPIFIAMSKCLHKYEFLNKSTIQNDALKFFQGPI